METTSPSGMIDAAKTVMASGSTDAERASMMLLKASADLAQSQLVSIFERAQKDLINELIRLSNKDLVTYHIEAALARCNLILRNLKSDAETVSASLVHANLIAGRIQSRLKSGDHDLVSAFDIIAVNSANAERLVNQMMGSINHASDSAGQSIRAQLQAACAKANMSKDMAQNIEIKVEFPSIDKTPIGQTMTAIIKHPKKLTKKQQAALDKDPVKAAREIAKQAYQQIHVMRQLYVIGRREADLVRQKTLQSVAMNEAKGGGLVNARKDLISELMQNGLTAFVDRSGRRWTLGNYCEMAVRTTSRQSTNFGELFDDPEHDLYIVVDRHSSCPICAKFEGRVFSRSGTNPNYPPLSDAFGKIDPNGPGGLENTYLSIHPNCRHTISKWVERAHSPIEVVAARNNSDPATNPYDLDPRTEKEVKRYQELERQKAQRAACIREYRKMMQFIPVKELGSWLTFAKHYIAKDDKYQALREKYQKLSKS
jgi:hypothetical protein